jgi:uncharacterized protein with ParB-like and HNH nuclease domain
MLFLFSQNIFLLYANDVCGRMKLIMINYEPNRTTVGQLFKNDNQLMIPRFQRSYEWKDANIEEFYDDFVKTTDDNLNFLGNIVIDASVPGVYSVIDGQQRLITLTILCACIRDLLREDILTQAASELASKIDTTYLRSGVTFSSSSDSIFKLTPSKELEDFFYAYIQQGGENYRKTLPRHDSHKNVVKAYKKFRQLLVEEKLSSNTTEDIKVKFLEQVMDRIHKITLITIAIYDQDAAYAIFESFNAKRVDLSVSDLVKNYYFSKLKGNEATVSNNMDRWDHVVVHVTSIPGARVDRFLHYYLQSRDGKFTKSSLYRKLRKEIDLGPEKFIKQLEGATDVYAQLRDSNIQADERYSIPYESLNKFNGSLEGINGFNVEQCFIFLMSMMLNKQKLTPKYLAKITELIENFTFIFSKISNGQANVLERLYSDFAKEISGSEMPKDPNIYSGQIYAKLKKAFNAILPRYESFEADFIELDYSSPQQKRLINYIFEKIEIYNTKGGSELGQLANIDHIFPQNPSHTTRPRRYHKIGNLLPIDRDTNSKVGNKLPVEKLGIYENIKNITQVQSYLEFVNKHGSAMNDELIDARAKTVAELAYKKVWSILD